MKLNFLKNGGVIVNFVYGKDENKVLVNPYDKKIYVELVKSDKVNKEDLRVIFFELAKQLEENKINEIEISMPEFENICHNSVASCIVEGLIQAEYKFDRYMSNKKDEFELSVNFINISDSQIKSAEEISEVLKSVFYTRDLVNQPSNYIYPETLAKNALDILEPVGVKVSVYDEVEIQKMGMEAFYSVGKGSDRPPRLIVMEYNNDASSDQKLALVGKGITYDSGGYSIKPNDGMKTMFTDMAGAATVIGAIHAIANQKLKINVVGVVAACENAVSGHSYKPGDVIGSLSGKTIEVDNTDAEGRVTLADSVYYAATTMGATKIIDLATLTGACLIALGHEYTGSVTNDDKFFADVKRAGAKVGERIWQLPFDKDFGVRNSSNVADIKNSGGRLAGTISAGMFISEFNNNLPWVHLDIAGTAYLPEKRGYLPIKATGIHVKTLYQYAKNELDCK